MNTNTVEKVASTGLLLLATLVFTSVLLRIFVNWPIPDTLDLSRILLGVTVMWSISLTITQDTHIQVDLLWNKLGPRAKLVVTILNRILMVIFTALFAYLIIEHVWNLAFNGKQTVDYRLPLWVFYLVILPTGVLAFYASLKHLARTLRTRHTDD